MAAPPLWWAGIVICAVCSKSHAAVVPVDRDNPEPPTGMECPYCRSMSCVPVYDVEEGDNDPGY